MKVGNLLLIISCVLLAAGSVACGDTSDDDPSNNDPNNAPNNDPNNDPNNAPNNDPNNDPGNLSCDDFTACGGDLIGSWSFVEVCVDDELDNPFGDQCPEAEASLGFEFDGDIEINADNTYAVNIESTITINFKVPTSCLGGSCEPLEEDFDCTLDGDTCDCTQVEEDTDEDSGTFAVDGNTVTFTSDDDGSADNMDFCVSGDSALLKPEADEEDDPDLVFEIARQ